MGWGSKEWMGQMRQQHSSGMQPGGAPQITGGMGMGSGMGNHVPMDQIYYSGFDTGSSGMNRMQISNNEQLSYP